jgi:hypothetical protein
MIEVIETYHADGTHAEVTGGKTPVTITPAPAAVVPGHYTDSHKMSRPNYWTQPVTIPAGFIVRWKGNRTRVKGYARAVKVAVYHAQRS